MFKELLNKVVIGENLREKEARWTMNEIMQGKVSAAQIASFLTALRIKRETVEEITGCAQAMRENTVKLKKVYPLAVDTCGTGGDCKGTFNISTITAGVKYQVLGVYDLDLTELIAGVLEKLGVEEAMVVCGESGIDEITLTGTTKISRVNGGRVETFYLKPEELGLRRCKLKDIQGGEADINAEIVLEILNGRRKSFQRDIVLANAAAVLVVGGIVENMREGVEKAAEVIDSGAALKKLEELRYYTNRVLIYTSDAADEEDSVDLGGRRIIKKKKEKKNN